MILQVVSGFTQRHPPPVRKSPTLRILDPPMEGALNLYDAGVFRSVQWSLEHWPSPLDPSEPGLPPLRKTAEVLEALGAVGLWCGKWCVRNIVELHPLKFNKSHLKIGQNPKGNARTPTIHFQMRTVSLPEGSRCFSMENKRLVVDPGNTPKRPMISGDNYILRYGRIRRPI